MHVYAIAASSAGAEGASAEMLHALVTFLFFTPNSGGVPAIAISSDTDGGTRNLDGIFFGAFMAGAGHTKHLNALVALMQACGVPEFLIDQFWRPCSLGLRSRPPRSENFCNKTVRIPGQVALTGICKHPGAATDFI